MLLVIRPIYQFIGELLICTYIYVHMYLVPFATIAISHREGHEAASKLMHIYIIFIRHTLNSNVAINGYTMESYICMRVFF